MHGAATPGVPATRDHGAIIVLTMTLTVVLAIVVLALATFVTTGLSTSRVTTERVRGIADLEIAAHDIASQLAESAACPTALTQGFTVNGIEVDLSGCHEVAPGPPIRFRVELSAGSQRLIAEIDVVPSGLLQPGHEGIAVVTSLDPG